MAERLHDHLESTQSWLSATDSDLAASEVAALSGGEEASIKSAVKAKQTFHEMTKMKEQVKAVQV